MVHALIDAGERVVVLDNLSTGFVWAVPPGATLVTAESGDQACVAALITQHRVEAVIHFAASIVVPESVRDPLAYYRNNTVNLRALIEAIVQSGVRHFIFSSTAAVYGNPSSKRSSAFPKSILRWSSPRGDRGSGSDRRRCRARTLDSELAPPIRQSPDDRIADLTLMYRFRHCCNFAAISHSSYATTNGIRRKWKSYSLVSATPRDFEFYCNQVGLNHFSDQRLKWNLVMPSELGSRLCRIAKQHVDFGRPEVTGVYFDKDTAVARIYALFFQAGTFPFQAPADACKRFLDKFSNRMRLTGRQHIIVGHWLLNNEPHPFYVIACVAPITPGVQITKKDAVLET
jgi:hypothetical protein